MTTATLRDRAVAAGAERVYPYQTLFKDGPGKLCRLDVPQRCPVMTAVAPRPTIPAARYADRLRARADVAAEYGVDALLIGVGPDLRYLTGYEAMPLERLTMLVVVPGHEPVIVVPRLERAAAEQGLRTDVEILTWGETDDPHGLVMRHVEARRYGAIQYAVSDTLTAMHLLRFQGARPHAGFEVASNVLRDLRMTKDADEIALLTLAAHAADRVVAAIAAGRLVGRTEADVAHEVQDRLIEEGHDLGLFAIVGSGPNSASPHHEASERVIEAGEPIVLDIGGVLGGYGSDITRTLWVTGGDPAKGPDERFRHLFGVLHGAQAAATAAVAPGITLRGDRRDRAPDHRCGGLRRGVLPPDRPRHRARGTRGSVPDRGQRAPPRRGDGVLRRARDLPRGSSTAPGSRTSSCAVRDGPIVLNEAPRELYVVDG